MKNDLRKTATWKTIIDDTCEGLEYGLKELKEEDYHTDKIYIWVDTMCEHNIWIYEEEEEELTNTISEILDEEYRNSQNTLNGGQLTRAIEAYLPIAVMKACNEKMFDALMEEDQIQVYFGTSLTDYQEIASIEKGKTIQFDLDKEFKKIKLLNQTHKGTFTDERDGKQYTTITLGQQEWLAENLAFEVKGKEAQNLQKWGELPNDKWCYYNNDKANAIKEKYGILYQLTSAKEACLDGWRIPNNEDWMTLCKYVGEEFCNGAELSFSNDNDERWSIRDVGIHLTANSFGFVAKSGGRRLHGVPADFALNGFKNGGRGNAYFWTLTDENVIGLMNIGGSSSVRFITRGKNTDKILYGYSVRCVRNVE